MKKIQIVDYQKVWANRFSEEVKLLIRTVGFLHPSIHHIGSTSVPGLAANPTIDILIEVDDVNKLDGHSERFKGIVYLSRGELGIPGRRFLSEGR